MRRFALWLCVIGLGATPARAADSGDPVAGETLYRTGVARSSAPVAGNGSIFACVRCHRRSGYGSSEGGVFVPPITAAQLFEPRRLDRTRNFKYLFQQAQPTSYWARVRQPRMRPAYADDSLAAAIRDGVDSSGAALDPAMPRYRLTDADMADLIAYLHTLSATPAPGIDGDEIHLATIIGAGTDPDSRAALVETLRKFVAWENLHTAGDQARPAASPYYRAELLSAARHWTLDVWELGERPEDWPQALERQYQARPVFAVLGGLVPGDWTPIADFCDRRHLPCLFPSTELPRRDGAEGAYSVYFSGGLQLEGDALAAYLATKRPAGARIVQIHATKDEGKAPARRFAAALRARLPGVALDSIEVTDPAALAAAIANQALGSDDVLILWPGAWCAAAIAALDQAAPAAGTIALPDDCLAAAQAALAPTLLERTVLSDPFELPDAVHPRTFRVRAWLNSHGVPLTHPTVQLQAYYAATLFEAALDQIVPDFNADYLLEAVEREAESDLNPGLYPRLALGPDQRFASKGARIIRLDPTAASGIRPVSDWLIP
jgi:ABC-type branched-subunit amino acid transport system substrate-binding protein